MQGIPSTNPLYSPINSVTLRNGKRKWDVLQYIRASTPILAAKKGNTND